MSTQTIDEQWKRALADLVTRYPDEPGVILPVEVKARTRLLQYATSAMKSASDFLTLLETGSDTDILEAANNQDENTGHLLRYLILKNIVFDKLIPTPHPS